jgi:hypothetical protein
MVGIVFGVILPIITAAVVFFTARALGRDIAGFPRCASRYTFG